MPVDVQCTACGQRLRVGDGLAGKQANCPKCKAKVNIPALASPNSTAKATAAPAGAANTVATTARAQVGGTRVATATPATSTAPASAPVMTAAPVKAVPIPPPDEWHLQTPDGQQYGPISKAELDSWLAEDRIAADSQLLPPGGESWVAATQIYPSLAQSVQQPVMQQPVMQPQAPQFSSIAVPAMAPVQNPVAAMPTFPAAAPSFAANAYASPTTSGGPTTDAGDDIGSLAISRRLLIETRPWVLFTAIVGLLYGALVILSGIGYFGLAVMALGSRGAAAGAITGIVAIVQLAFGSVAIYAFVCLISYATRIGEFQRSTSVRSLEGALRAQRSYWRLAGILLAIVLGLIVLGIVLVVAGGIGLGLQEPSRL